MIDTSNGNLFSTAPSSVDQSKEIKVYSKILGYNPIIDSKNQKLIPFKTILPISINLLNFILTNLISIILEIFKRDLATPNIDINNIMMIEDNYACGIPFIFSNQDKTTARQCEKKLVTQFSQLCKHLGYDQDLINCSSLDKFQQLLLSRINFEKDSQQSSYTFLNNCNTIFQYMQIQNTPLRFSNDFTKLYTVQTPKFIFNPLDEEIAIKISIQDSQVYELREVQIIEDFNNKHVPYLYGYIRYSDILVLFLKKHKWTFNFILNDLYKGRRDLNSEQIEKICLRLYQQMIKAIKYIHSIGIIHRDIKPENIMFDLSQPIQNYIEITKISINCVLIDFDRSTTNGNYNAQNPTHYVGTTFFRPPEGEQNIYNPSYDIWQLGFMWFVIQKQFFITKSKDYEQFIKMQISIQQFNDQIRVLNQILEELNLNQQELIHRNKQGLINLFKEELNLSQRELIQRTLQELINLNQQELINQKKQELINLIKEREKQYNELIQKIDQHDNFFTYNIELQSIIKKMIELDPQKRANLDEIQNKIDSLIQQ